MLHISFYFDQNNVHALLIDESLQLFWKMAARFKIYKQQFPDPMINQYKDLVHHANVQKSGSL